MVLNSIMQFVLRWFFVKTLGAEYLGLNQLFVSIFAMLSLIDLGLGGVIGFSLYEPLAQKNQEKVAALVKLYRKAYAVIAILVIVIGLTLLPFISFFIKTSQPIESLNAFYLLALLNTISGYFFSYNQILLNADQRGYIATKINMIYGFVNSLILILVLVVNHSYFRYLLVSFFLSLIIQLVIYKKVKSIYGYIYHNNEFKISRVEYAGIISNVKAMFFHRIGDFAVNSTDILIISKFVSLVSVGYFSNYSMMLIAASRFMDSIFGSMIAGFGQLLAEGGKERADKLFSGMNFLCFWLYGMIGISFFCLANPIIYLLFGDEFILNLPIVGLLALNFYITGMRIPPHIVKSAAGVFVQDKYIPIIQSIVNLVISIIAVQYWGMLGVFLGTFVSSFFPSIARPYVACKYGLKRSSRPYFIYYLKYFILFSVLGLLSYSLCLLIFPNPTWITLLGRFFILVLTFNIPVYFIFRKVEQTSLLITKLTLFLNFIKKSIYA